MFHFQFIYPPKIGLSFFQKKLFLLGFSDFYELQEGRKNVLGCFHAQQNPILGDLDAFLFLKESSQIDWESQWKLTNHTLTFKDRSWTIRPGEGFGDFSHPTTQMVAAALESYCKKGDLFIDIGCGSGILSLLALQAGASHVIAIDLCDRALAHAQRTFSENRVDHLISLQKAPLPPLELTHPPLIGINMTWGEQQEALPHYLYLLKSGAIAISSGILEDQIEDYQAWLSHLGYQANPISSSEGWALFEITK